MHKASSVLMNRSARLVGARVAPIQVAEPSLTRSCCWLLKVDVGTQEVLLACRRDRAPGRVDVALGERCLCPGGGVEVVASRRAPRERVGHRLIGDPPVSCLLD